jgi:tRNA(fMet)-specific endonuclease VapC
MTIFDTDVFTLFTHGNDKISRRIQGLPDDEVLAVTLVTQMEVLRGRFASVEKASGEEELKSAVERFRLSEQALAQFQVIYPDDAAAQHFERLRTAQGRGGWAAPTCSSRASPSPTTRFS